MFFSERITGIKNKDRVLEIGPGADPFHRSDILLELSLTEEELAAQRGYAEMKKFKQEIVYYDGGRFPFKDNEFDYVICAHVLEHVENIQLFLSELTRVAKRGYIEFPTVYYDHLYNFNVHLNLLRFDEKSNTIYYLKKTDTPFPILQPVHDFFYRSLELGYTSLIDDLKLFMFQGFEWNKKTPILKKAESFSDLILDIKNMPQKVLSDSTVILSSETDKPELKRSKVIKERIARFFK